MYWPGIIVMAAVPILHLFISRLFSWLTVKAPTPVAVVEEAPVNEIAEHDKWRREKLDRHRERLQDWQDDFEALLPDNEKADLVISNLLSVNEQRTLAAVQIPYITHDDVRKEMYSQSLKARSIY